MEAAPASGAPTAPRLPPPPPPGPSLSGAPPPLTAARPPPGSTPLSYPFLVAVHCGAGAHAPAKEPAYRHAMAEACRAAAAVLAAGGSAEAGVAEAVRVLEDSPCTNSGTGSSLNLEGAVECDAAMMAGDGAFGAMGAVAGVQNPILAAAALAADARVPLSCGRVRPMLLAGEGARSYAATCGLEVVQPGQRVPPGFQVTPASLAAWRRYTDIIRQAATATTDATTPTTSTAATTPPTSSAPQPALMTMAATTPSTATAVAAPAHPQTSANATAATATAAAAAVAAAAEAAATGPGAGGGAPVIQLGSGTAAAADPRQRSTRGRDPDPDLDPVPGHHPSRDGAIPVRTTKRLRRNVVAAAIAEAGGGNGGGGDGGGHAAVNSHCAGDTAAAYDRLDEDVDDVLFDTVGALCVDYRGRVAAGVSSGGIPVKFPGRVGEAAMYGSGCWAQDPWVCNACAEAAASAEGAKDEGPRAGVGSAGPPRSFSEVLPPRPPPYLPPAVAPPRSGGCGSSGLCWCRCRPGFGASVTGVGEAVIRADLARQCSAAAAASAAPGGSAADGGGGDGSGGGSVELLDEALAQVLAGRLLGCQSGPREAGVLAARVTVSVQRRQQPKTPGGDCAAAADGDGGGASSSNNTGSGGGTPINGQAGAGADEEERTEVDVSRCAGLGPVARGPAPGPFSEPTGCGAGCNDMSMAVEVELAAAHSATSMAVAHMTHGSFPAVPSGGAAADGAMVAAQPQCTFLRRTPPPSAGPGGQRPASVVAGAARRGLDPPRGSSSRFADPARDLNLKWTQMMRHCDPQSDGAPGVVRMGFCVRWDVRPGPACAGTGAGTGMQG